MECLQFFPGHAAVHLCQSSSLPVDLLALTIPTIYWAMATVATLLLWVVLWYDRSKASFGFRSSPLFSWRNNQTPILRAESRLLESTTQQEYDLLLHFGYLEIPSKLYPTLFYRILRQRRVHVYDLCKTGKGQRCQKLGELCVITQHPMADADSILLHKWLIEADEQAYLETANWVGHSGKMRLLQANGSYAIQYIYRERQSGTLCLPVSC